MIFVPPDIIIPTIPTPPKHHTNPDDLEDWEKDIIYAESELDDDSDLLMGEDDI